MHHARIAVIALACTLACGSSRDSFQGENDPNNAGPPGTEAFPNQPADPIYGCPGHQTTSSIGCEYYAVHMDGTEGADNGCFAVFVANVEGDATHIDASFGGTTIDLAKHARIPRGAGKTLVYEPYDPVRGLHKDEVAILFLAGPAEVVPPNGKYRGLSVPCPVAPARNTLTQVHGTGRGGAFRVRTDAPVVAYQILPYGGGSAAVTGSTLLLPTSAYASGYIAATPAAPGSMDVVAAHEQTTVTIVPSVALEAGGGVEGSPERVAHSYQLDAGEVLQFTQPKELTGSIVTSDKPIGLFTGVPCMNVPDGMLYCDHAEQQIPPVNALGSEHVAVGHRARTDKAESYVYRIVGAVDGTLLTFDPPQLPDNTTPLERGQVIQMNAADPFVVRSQDASHPFMLLGYMTSSMAVAAGYGDPEVVRTVPPQQFLDRYVFFTDPTYPETNLVVTRKRGGPDVKLDCLGTMTGFTQVGASDWEIARVDLVRHDFVPQLGCDNGRHVMESTAPFGLVVWGWGTPETTWFTIDVSYGYAAGENIAAINDVVLPH
jgi:hypothetical protein